MLGGDIGAGMYRKAMSMHIAAGDGFNSCGRDDGHALDGRDEGVVFPSWLQVWEGGECYAGNFQPLRKCSYAYGTRTR
jgi:hypothetical protein